MTTRPMVAMTTTILTLALLVPALVAMETVAKELSVPIGRETELDPSLLGVKLEEDEMCKVEVNAYDHMSLRVGHVEPKTFDCRFEPGQVRYIHSGSPLLKEDTINLRIYRFTKLGSAVQDIKLTIKIKQEGYKVFHTLKPLRVKRFNGLSNQIDDSVVRFRFNEGTNTTCMVGFSRYSTPWPSAGQMVVGSKGQPVDSLWRNCHEFLQYGLRYQHLVPPTPDSDYLPLKVKLHLPFSGMIVERLYLPIKIDGAFPNIPPKASFIKSYVMQVDQYIMTVLSPTVLGAQDNETPQGSLVYNVTRPLGRGQGHLIHLADRTMPVTSFLQSDLTNQNIAYQPPMIPYPDQTDFQIEFTIFDASFQSSMPTKFHISVRPTHTDAPRIAVNSGLIVLEGGETPIRNTDLLIVDNDLSQVHIHIKGGLQRGALTINDRAVMSFTPRDLELGQVIYKHDDSDTTSDSLLLRITDGINTIQARLHIHIVAKDDTPPFLVNKFDLDIQEGELVQITDSMLFSHDEDSSDADIFYRVTKEPKYGQIIRRTSEESRGLRASEFSQDEIERGYLYYIQTVPDSSLDSISFTIEDKQIPPNVSPEYMMMVRIRPPYNAPPRRKRGTENSITTKETDIVYIDKYRLGYEDPDTDPKKIIYTITAQPFFVSSQETMDAGRVINVQNIYALDVVKDESIPPLVTFTQAEVNDMKIAYMPPIQDIGPESRVVRIYYTVSDDTGNILNGLTFQINVTPINNKPPEFLTNPLSVHEGASTGITVRQISVIDEDTLPEDISLYLDVRPSRGIVKFDGVPMDVGDKFTLEDIGKSKIGYWHDGSDDQATDSFGISVSDSEHRITKAIPVQVILIDDQPPTLETKATRKFTVDEGGEFKLIPDVLSAMDGDTPADNIRFTIIKTPSRGSILDGETLVSRFTQNDIEKGRIRYVHNGKEIGPHEQEDSFQFILSDIPLSTVEDKTIDYVNITIKPVNNHAPQIVLGNPVIVLESGKTKLTDDIISALDVDTLDDELQFVILKYPDWGYIERSRKDNLPERVNEFWWTDIQEGLVSYVQGRHKLVEPISDTMTLKVNDGRFNSAETLVVITIIPQNDEMPEILLDSLNVTQGYDTMIGSELLMVTDLDVPNDVCIISIPILPAHGKLTMLVPVSGRDGMVQVPVHEFTMNDVKKGVRLLYKHYGGEETRDRMLIKVNDGKHTTEKEVNIDIIRVVDERPEVVKNTGLKILYGEKISPITSTVLQALDKDTDEEKIAYIIVNVPSHGKLQKLKQKVLKQNYESKDGELSDQATLQRVPDWIDLNEGMNFTQKDLNDNLVRYVHPSKETTDTDKFRFRVTDGISTSPKETFEISIEKNLMSEIELTVKNIKVKERRSVKISIRELSATDGTDMLNRITFHITKQPRYGNLEYVSDPGTPLRNFTQQDLASLRVQYAHTSWTEAVEDRFQFIVSNGNFIQNGTMYILIVPIDRITPTLEKNQIMYVALNKEVVITDEVLNAKDPDTPKQNLTFLIMKLPDYGELRVNDEHVGQEFYQSDIEEGRVTYRNYGQKIGKDEFWFAVTDRKHIGFIVNGTLKLSPIPFKIEVTKTEQRPPRLLTNQPPKILDSFSSGRVGYLITNKLLKVTSSSDKAENLRFLIIEQPRNGHLENLKTGMELGYSFTQADLDTDSVIYIIDENKDASNDSFIFTVEDSRRNVMDPTTYALSWSVVQFRQSQYIVCEDVGQLVVPVDRRGETDQQAYVGIRVREMSAKTHQDFRVPKFEQVKFNEDDAEATYEVTIHEDDEVEKHEKVKLILKSPINTLIGKTGKTTITIVNKNTASGACAPVEGMIAKGGHIADVSPEPEPEEESQEPEDVYEEDELFAEDVDESDDDEVQEESTAMVPQSDAAAKDKQQMRKAFNRLEEDKSGRVALKPRTKKGRKRDRNQDKPDKKKKKRKKNRNKGRKKKDREQRRRERLEKRRRNRQRKGKSDKTGQQAGADDLSEKKRRRKGRRNRDRKEEAAEPVVVQPQGMREETMKPVLVGLPTQPAPLDQGSDVLSDTEKKPVIDPALRNQLLQQWSSLEANSGDDNANETKQAIGGCTPTTKGFYHKDPATNQVYRCDGRGWVTVTNIRLPNLDSDRRTPLGTPVRRQDPNQYNRRRSKEPIISGEAIPSGGETSQCPKDWVMFSGRCYLPSTEQLSWNEAQAACERRGGNLPSVWAKKQAEWMVSMAGRKRMWIGLNDKLAYQNWVYANNDPLNYTNWKAGYPRGRRTGNKNCIMISRDLTWSNRPCDSRKAKFVCSKLPSSINRRFDLN